MIVVLKSVLIFLTDFGDELRILRELPGGKLITDKLLLICCIKGFKIPEVNRPKQQTVFKEGEDNSPE